MAETRSGRRDLSPQREPRGRWAGALLAVPVVAVGLVILRYATRTRAASAHHAAVVLPLVAAVLAGIVAMTLWALRAAPQRLDYRLRGRSLEVSTLLTKRRLRLASVTRAEVVEFDLHVTPGVHMGWPNSHMPGYYVGRFPLSGLGGTRVVVGVRRGTGVLLHVKTGAPVLLAPEEPAALAALIEDRTGGRP